ncbi:MAG: DUF1150 family protein [Proteobacteria bacterium]|nr:DUF1150 family protein [Pseudomonadota bacterium]MBI3498505.1 DUF1150 family protein [Pseudomonadota bacterium]
MTTVNTLRSMSPTDVAALGLNHLAYVKRVVVNDVVGYAIHAADGTEMGVARDRDTAFAAVRQHELEPLSVH